MEEGVYLNTSQRAIIAARIDLPIQLAARAPVDQKPSVQCRRSGAKPSGRRMLLPIKRS
jgi:hypothetical protein